MKYRGFNKHINQELKQIAQYLCELLPQAGERERICAVIDGCTLKKVFYRPFALPLALQSGQLST